MTAEKNKAVIQRFYLELQKGNFGVVGDTYAPDYISHNNDAPEGEQPGIDGAVQAFQAFMSAFPDVSMVDEILVAEGDFVAHHIRYRATHTGSFHGMPATGRQVNLSGIDLYRFSNGKVVEKWGVRDRLQMLEQLKAVAA